MREKKICLFTLDHITRHYFRTYLIVLIFPLILGCVYYQRATSIVYQDAIERSNAVLKQAAVSTELRFNEISRFADSVITNPDVHTFQFVQEPFSYPNTYQLIELRDELARMSVDNQMIDNYYLFYHRNEACCSSKYAYSYRTLYDLFYRDQYDSYEEFRDYLYTIGEHMGFQNLSFDLIGSKVPRIVYIRPFLSTSGEGGFLIILLNDKNFQEQFSSIVTEESGIYIEDQGGNLLYQYANNPLSMDEIDTVLREKPISVLNETRNFKGSLEGRKLLVSTVNAGEHRYISTFPYFEVTKSANSLLFILIFVLAGSAVFGIFLSLEMSRRTVRPLTEIFKQIADDRPESTDVDIYEQLRAFYQNIMRYNKEIEASLEKQKPYIQYTFLYRMIHGEFTSEEEAVTLAGYCGLTVSKGNNYTILIFRISTMQLPLEAPDLSYVHACRIALREALQHILPESLAFEPEMDQIALLYVSEGKKYAELEEQLRKIPEKLKNYMPSEFFYSIAIYIGNTVDTLSEIVRSYENSRSMFFVHPIPAQPMPLILFEETPKPKLDYFYPTDVEMNVINFTIIGDEENLHKTLHNLLQKNIMECSLPRFLQHQFFNDLTGTLVRILGRLQLDEESFQNIYYELEMLEEKDDLQKAHKICGLFEQLCRLVASRNVSVTSGVIDAVTAYIDAHYTSPDFSLTEVADTFKVSESYLSFTFKQYKNVNFSVYVESLRMNHARELLLSMDCTTAEVASACGYYSSNTFCRAFKRFWGYTTTQCRNRQRSSEEAY